MKPHNRGIKNGELAATDRMGLCKKLNMKIAQLQEKPHSPTEHENVVQGRIILEGCHLLETQLLAAAIEAVGAVHPDVAVIAA